MTPGCISLMGPPGGGEGRCKQCGADGAGWLLLLRGCAAAGCSAGCLVLCWFLGCWLLWWLACCSALLGCGDKEKGTREREARMPVSVYSAREQMSNKWANVEQTKNVEQMATRTANVKLEMKC